MSAKLEYPAARRDETVTNDFHGIAVSGSSKSNNYNYH